MIWFLAAKWPLISLSFRILRPCFACCEGGGSWSTAGWCDGLIPCGSFFKLIGCRVPNNDVYYSIYLSHETYKMSLFQRLIHINMYICLYTHTYFYGSFFFWSAHLNIQMLVNNGTLGNTTVNVHSNMITSQPVGLPCGLLIVLDWNHQETKYVLVLLYNIVILCIPILYIWV